jgi:uncharacterized lipoprotein YddW (UPF0748 family)
MRRWLFVLVMVGCGTPLVGQDGGVDAGDHRDPDAGLDAGPVLDGGPGDAGEPDGGRVDAGALDAGRDAGLTDGGVSDGGAPTLVTVNAPRELRGVWVATVANLDWPASTGLSAAAGRASLEALVGGLADAGLNAIFFQVRPESDALYASSLEPWSRTLTGTQGVDPGWDPLAVLISTAHAQGVEVHAWMNPYRALVATGSQTASTSVVHTLAVDAVTYNGQVVMNPASSAVRTHVVDVVKDLLAHYDVDGLHFDDYFYPYPDAANTPFPDGAQYQAYTSGGGSLSLANWRRGNVDALVSAVMSTVTTLHPAVRFGIAPFGIYRSGTPAGTSGLSGVDVLYCDAVKWMNQGWVDYLAPQLYWPTTQSAQSYTTLATWWANGTMGGRHLFPGHATYQLGTSGAWTLAEYEAQVAVTRSLSAHNALGDLHFRAANVLANRSGVLTAFKSALYATPALVPELPRTGASVTPPVPLVSVSAGVAMLGSAAPGSTRFFALYRQVAAGWALQRVVGASTSSVSLSSGTWAVTAVAPGGAESQGVVLTVP